MTRTVILDAETLFQYAISSGDLYEDHIALTRGCYSRSAWSLHIADRVVPGYRREFHEPDGYLSVEHKQQLIERLKDYYTAHVAEMA